MKCPDKEFKAFMEKCIKEGKDRLDLNFWRIELKYVGVIKSYKEDEVITFEIETDHMYMEATISVSKLAYDNWRLGKGAYVARDVLHELTHILTEPLAEYAKKHMGETTHDQLLFLEENLTQRITMLL
jgi:hypothetical protein